MLDDLGEVVGLQGVEHVEEVLPRRALASWVNVRLILHNLLVIFELWVQRPHLELVIVRDLYRDDLVLLQ